jgi:hypothetical protein
MSKLIVTFHNFAKVPKIENSWQYDEIESLIKTPYSRIKHKQINLEIATDHKNTQALLPLSFPPPPVTIAATVPTTHFLIKLKLFR